MSLEKIKAQFYIVLFLTLYFGGVMKKIFYSFCVISLVILSSCASKNIDINTDNCLETYNNYKQKFDNSNSNKTTTKTYINNSSSANDEPETIEFTTDYSEVKNGEDKEAYVFLENKFEDAPIEIELYYKDNSIYASRSYDDLKVKFDVSYDDFKNVYSAFHFLNIDDEDIISTQILNTTEYIQNQDEIYDELNILDSDTVVEFTLNNESYSEIFDNEMSTVELSTFIPREYLNPEFSDIQYIVDFDNKGNVKYIDMNYDITMNFKVSDILNFDSETMEKYNLTDKIILRNVHTISEINQLNNINISYPDDLDTYIVE